MGIAVWGAVVGALLGFVLADFSQFGFIFGGALGAGLGVWLRSAIRQEIGDAVRSALSGGITNAPSAQPAPATSAAVRPQSEPARVVTKPVGDAPKIEESPAPGTRSAAPFGAPLPRRLEPSPPSPASVFMGKARDWLFGGNTILRVGIVILFLGLVFLVRFAAMAGLFPIEARLSLVAAVGVVLLAIGLRKRTERPAFSLSLQGAGIAILYLVVFAAARGYGIVPPVAAFALLILFAALGCALAVMQDSLVMAFIAFLGGFAVPVLLGGRSETPLGLFTYMTTLNLAIFGIAWKKRWRPLNLLGFVATFALASLWGFSAYEPQHYLLCQGFLIVSMAIYLATAVLYAHNTPGKFGNYADSTLLFGTALAGFGLQVGLVHDRPFASAWSALGFGAAYIAVTAMTIRRGRPEMRLLNECLLAIGIGFVTLAVPLALDVNWTSCVWALEGAGAFWVGARQARWVPRCLGLVLQAVAALLTLAEASSALSAIPLANSGFLQPMLVALPMIFTAWIMRKPLDHSGSSWAKGYAVVEGGLRQIWFLGGFTFVCQSIVLEALRATPDARFGALQVFSTHTQVYAIMLGVLGAMTLADGFGRKNDWSVAGWPAKLSLPFVSICLLLAMIEGRHLLYLPDILFWSAALGLHIWLLRRQPVSVWTHAMHVGGVLLVTALVADCIWLGIESGNLWETSWAGVTFLVSATAILLLLVQWPGRAARSGSPADFSWPLNPYAKAYWLHGAVVLAVLVYVGALSTCLVAEGVTDPLPYIPLLNPVDLSALLALAALALWRKLLQAARPRVETVQLVTGRAGLAAMALLAFVLANTIWLRSAHHLLGVDWQTDALAGSQIVQSGYSILWALMAMGLMFLARSRAERLPWLAGAVLLAIVVAKLAFVDMSQVEGLARIIAFIAVGVLMLLIGYFVPIPPRAEGTKEAAA
ncbi:DUF2339 domain-containing protein [Aquisediminimonas profunda]|uniref:DUF2339 domain-containing protein n=1 Tax=Aquisediminimonas profunda TaxID=1550733 RepID=UPI001C62583A|nr:DUF2339 domain-containing protein [Aquisediminimonas profunda]